VVPRLHAGPLEPLLGRHVAHALPPELRGQVVVRGRRVRRPLPGGPFAPAGRLPWLAPAAAAGAHRGGGGPRRPGAFGAFRVDRQHRLGEVVHHASEVSGFGWGGKMKARAGGLQRSGRPQDLLLRPRIKCIVGWSPVTEHASQEILFYFPSQRT
jgi:hypothetical protein